MSSCLGARRCLPERSQHRADVLLGDPVRLGQIPAGVAHDTPRYLHRDDLFAEPEELDCLLEQRFEDGTRVDPHMLVVRRRLRRLARHLPEECKLAVVPLHAEGVAVVSHGARAEDDDRAARRSHVTERLRVRVADARAAAAQTMPLALAGRWRRATDAADAADARDAAAARAGAEVEIEAEGHRAGQRWRRA